MEGDGRGGDEREGCKYTAFTARGGTADSLRLEAVKLNIL